MIYGVGESLVDIIFKNNSAVGSTPGGSVLNSTVSAARLGASASLVTDLGRDTAGQLVMSFLKDNGVSFNHAFIHDEDQTTIALAFLNESGDASYQFYKISSLPSFNVNFNAADVLLAASFYAISPRTSEAVNNLVDDALRASAFVFYDPNYRPGNKEISLEDSRERVIDLINKASAVRLSEEDSEYIFSTKDCSQIVNMIPSLSQKPLILTRAANGVDLYYRGMLRSFDSVRIDPVSTIGAGDTFNAGIVAAVSAINPDARSQLDIEFYGKIIEAAIKLSASVCLSMDNYIQKGDYTSFWNFID